MAALTGKTALITGGSRGIGAAIVRRLAADGADVAFSYAASAGAARSLVAEIEVEGGSVLALHGDQGTPADVQRLVEDADRALGGFDILVNCAGIFGMGAVDDPATDFAALDRLMRVNLTGTVALVRAAVASIRNDGRIILIGSTVGLRVAVAGVADYAASKAAVIAYAKGWARDLGERRITVNVVNPGPTATDMMPDATPYAEAVKSGLALRRLGRPAEIAAMVAFLASDQASFITGTTLDVDGGQLA